MTPNSEQRGKEAVNNPDVTENLPAPATSAPASGSASRTVHMCVSIEGVLRWPDNDLRNMFTDDAGNRQPASLVRDFLKLELAKGRKVLPMGEPCEGWSYETGCPGHVTPNAKLTDAAVSDAGKHK